MARRKHGGLGRGLDALIPQAAPRQAAPEQTADQAAQTNNHSDQPAQIPVQSAEQETGAEGFGSVKRNVAVPEKNTVKTGEEGPKQAENEETAEGKEQTALLSESISKTTPMEDPGIQVGEDSEVFRESGIESPTSGPAASRISETASAEEGVRMLRLSQVDPNRSQPRQNFADEALEELAESIRQFGVLQPILVQKKGSRYEIIAGERRWRASRRAGLKEIPAIVRDYSSQETLELSLIENIQREDLNPIEEAKAFKRLLDEFGLRQEDLAARVSKSRTAITNAVRLLKLDERVQDMLVQDQISMGHARALLPLEIPDEQYLLAREVADKHLSVRDVEKLIKSRLSGKKTKGAGKKDKTSGKDPALELAYRSIEERLKQSLGTKAVIHGGANGTGKIEIEFYSSEDLEKLVDLLT